MEIDRRELKHRAREDMSLTKPPFWLVTLLYLLMTTGVGYLLSFLPPVQDPFHGFGLATFFAVIFLFLYNLVVDFGMNLWALWTSRHLNPGAGALIQGFSVAGRVLLMELFVALRILGWALCLSILLVPLLIIVSSTIPSLTPLCILILYAAIWAIMLRYALAPYLLADQPDAGAAAAVRRSVDLTRGFKWELFKLEFSFIGWLLIGMFLSVLANLFWLWQNGFFQALAGIPLHQIPDLIGGYFLWQSGVSIDLFDFSQQYVNLYTLYFNITNSLEVSLTSDFITLPLYLWLIPYRLVSRSGFYCARLRLQQQAAPLL
ncbi:MAG: DUF975 family protein [Lawsonibacter sp.]|jgi:hypothetical protein